MLPRPVSAQILGAEKFLDLKCRMNDLCPSAVVIVATVRALKHHGGVAKADLNTPNLERLEKGLPNLGRHIENIKDKFGLPCVVALNSFPTDSEEEVKAVFDYCRKMGVECSLSEVFAKGGKGGTDLANKVLQAMDDSAKINYAYEEDLTVDKKIEAICKTFTVQRMLSLQRAPQIC